MAQICVADSREQADDTRSSYLLFGVVEKLALNQKRSLRLREARCTAKKWPRNWYVGVRMSSRNKDPEQMVN